MTEGTGPTTDPVVGILAVQGDVTEHARALTRAGAQVIPVRRAVELEAVDGLVIPGGESTTIEKLVQVFELDELLRARIEAGLPVFGSCAGMIMLASQVLDGHPDQRSLGALDMTVRRNAFGRQVASFEADLHLGQLAEPERPFHAVFIRAPWVERVGPEVEVLGSVDGHVVAVRSGPVLATSFHPELTEDPRVHALFVHMVREAAGSIEHQSERGGIPAGEEAGRQ